MALWAQILLKTCPRQKLFCLDISDLWISWNKCVACFSTDCATFQHIGFRTAPRNKLKVSPKWRRPEGEGESWCNATTAVFISRIWAWNWSTGANSLSKAPLSEPHLMVSKTQPQRSCHQNSWRIWKFLKFQMHLSALLPQHKFAARRLVLEGLQNRAGKMGRFEQGTVPTQWVFNQLYCSCTFIATFRAGFGLQSQLLQQHHTAAIPTCRPVGASSAFCHPA